MPSYVPFLLPLLKETIPEISEAKASSPFDEEAVIRKHLRTHPGIWNVLGEQVEAGYGLRFLRELPAEVVPQGSSPPDVPLPWLIAACGERALFLITHPDSLEAFDAVAPAGSEPILLPASLFTRWERMLHQETDPGADSGRTDNAFAAYVKSIWQLHKPSDWHLEPGPDGYRSRFRSDGCLSEPERVSRERGAWFIQSAFSLAKLSPGSEPLPQEGGFQVSIEDGSSVNMRLSTIPSLHGDALVLRFLPQDIRQQPDFAALGVPSELCERMEALHGESEGLWLIAGPTGSGKSTTLAAILNMSVERGEKVLSVEDPVERPLPGVQQLSVGSPRGLTYAVALRAFLRQAPDTVMVGEIRDEETAAVALQASRTGHRVLSTLHAGDDAGVRRRFEDLKQDSASLGEVCRLLLHQRLVPGICSSCRTWEAPPLDSGRLRQETGLTWPVQVPFGNGCRHCRNGFRGRALLIVSGNPDHPQPTMPRFLREACDQITAGRISFDACLPFLPAGMRTSFGFASGKLSVKNACNAYLTWS